MRCLVKKNINFFLPINTVKSGVYPESREDGTQFNPREVYIVSGWASTPAVDAQNERVNVAGIDADYFLKSGWIDYEHDPEEVIGEPTQNSFADPEKGLFVEAALYKENPYVQKIIDFVDTLKKAGSNRKLGFSIEANATRSESDPSLLYTLFITGVAITKTPANLEATWDVVQKSLRKLATQEPTQKGEALEAGYDINPATMQDGAALKVEDLLGSLKYLSYSLDNIAPNQLVSVARQVATLVDKEPDVSPSLKPLVLQVFSGVSREQAKEKLTN